MLISLLCRRGYQEEVQEHAIVLHETTEGRGNADQWRRNGPELQVRLEVFRPAELSQRKLCGVSQRGAHQLN